MFLLPVFIWAGGAVAHAHPVTYQGAFGIMSTNGPKLSDQFLSYTVTSKFAVAARYLGVQDQASLKREFLFPQLNLLVKRWNEIGSQGNLYLSGAYGAEASDGDWVGAGLAALEADWESRKYYISGKYQVIRDSQKELLEFTRFRLGYAPYIAEFEGFHTWFMLQFDHQPDFVSGVQVTPLLRFFVQNVLWEVGASASGDWMFNFMVHI